MYTDTNFRTKKALREAVAAGRQVTVFNPGSFGQTPTNGKACLEGPHYPAMHTWYAEVTLRDGYVVKVK